MSAKYVCATCYAAVMLQLGLGTKTTLVRVSENIVVWLKMPRSRLEMRHLPAKNSQFFGRHNSWKCRQGSLKISSGVTRTVVGCLEALLAFKSQLINI